MQYPKHIYLFFTTILVLSFSLLSSAVANEIVRTDPARGSNISVSPSSISIQTSSPLSETGTKITVIDPNGSRVDDGSIVIGGTTLIAGLKLLAVTGVYTVNLALAAEGEDLIVGSYTFFFNAPAQNSESNAPSNTYKKLNIQIQSKSQMLIWGKTITMSASTSPKINGDCTFNLPVFGGIRYLQFAKAKLVAGKSSASFPVSWKADPGSSQNVGITVICYNSTYYGKSGKIFLGVR